ncbi:MAG: type I secretion system protein TolC [Sphingomonadales bacterium]|nr:type I secretion system protein TolC [Sphingomonadales bacterium]
MSCAMPPAGLARRVWRQLHDRRSARAEAVATAWTVAGQRLARAQAIGEAYALARAWQARLALRQAAPAMLRDNAEIARFRRDAGLVPGLDADMADLMLGLNGAGIDQAQGAFDSAVAALAGLTGADPAALRKALAGQSTAALPPEAPDALDRRPDLRALAARLMVSAPPRGLSPAALQAAIGAGRQPWAIQWAAAEAHARDDLASAHRAIVVARDAAAARAQLAVKAQRLLADARLGYRNGATGFATLFAAEAAGLATQEAEVEAARAVTVAELRLLSAQGRGETPTGACD